jgi:cytochrome c oxidase subunit 2
MPAALAAMWVAAVGGGAMAAQPENWAMGFQPPATVGMVEIENFHDLLLVIIVAITLFVTVLLAYVMWRFRASRNPTPSQTSHNTLIEVLWTIIPVIILVIIAIPSFNLLYFLDRTEEAEMTVKANGHQWYWSYEYPDHGNFSFASNMLAEDQLEEGQPYLLAVDNPLVVPVDTNVRLLVAGQDVIHSFGVTSFGLKLDAMPGRLNETWFKALATGIFYGQCSEICGTNHGFMPIEIHVVSKDEFAQWVEQRQAEYGITPPEATAVAAAD